MKDWTVENKKLLATGRHTAAPGTDVKASGCRIIPSRNSDDPSLVVPGPNGEIHLHSAYAPREEARRWAEHQLSNSGNSQGIVFGLGLGYHVEALLELKPEFENLTVIEVNPAVFGAALAARNLKELLSDTRVSLVAGPYPETASRIRTAIDNLSGDDAADVFIHRQSLEVYPDEASGLREILDYILLSASDTPVFQELKKSNVEKNRTAFQSAPGVATIFGSLSGKPALVAATGPSLSLSLDIMKKSGKNITTIAVDSALAPFHHAGLRPDFVVSGDPQAHCADLFNGLEPGDEKLVFFPSSCPGVISHFSQEHRYAAFSDVEKTDFPGSIQRDKTVTGSLYFSGTVLLAALDLAVKTGANPIAVIGADFSFMEDRTHASGSRTQGYIPRYGRPREVPGLDGKPVKTSDVLFLYLRDFEEYCANFRGETTVINCTVRGAAAQGVPHSSLESFLEKYS